MSANNVPEFDPFWDSDRWLDWLYAAEQAHCKHPAEFWVDESWATPDSGGDGGHCDRCQWGFSHVYY